MNEFIGKKLHEIERVCRQHRVRRIDLFGSATGSDFDPEKSDLDFIVSFQDLDIAEYADAYFGLLEDLQDLFRRPVDLVVDSAIQNPYFRRAVEASRTPIYET